MNNIQADDRAMRGDLFGEDLGEETDSVLVDEEAKWPDAAFTCAALKIFPEF